MAVYLVELPGGQVGVEVEDVQVVEEVAVGGDPHYSLNHFHIWLDEREVRDKGNKEDGALTWYPWKSPKEPRISSVTSRLAASSGDRSMMMSYGDDMRFSLDYREAL